jgi:hypothetical protein
MALTRRLLKWLREYRLLTLDKIIFFCYVLYFLWLITQLLSAEGMFVIPLFSLIKRSDLSSGAIALMMEAARTSETSVYNYFTRQYIPEDKPELHTRTSY